MIRGQGIKAARMLWIALCAALLLAACSGDEPAHNNTPTIALESVESRLAEIVAASDQKSQTWDSALEAHKGELSGAGLISVAYQSAGRKAVFASAGALTPAGEALGGILSGSHLEGLEPKDYHTERIAALIKELEAKAVSLRGMAESRPALTEDQREAVAEALEGLKPGTEADAAVLEVFASETGPLSEWIETYKKTASAVSGKTVEMEILLFDGALRYAHDVRHFNVHDVPEETREAEAATVIAERQSNFAGALLEAAHSAEPVKQVEALLVGLRPKNPQYALLMGAAKRYEAIVAEGGWPTAMPRIPEPPNPKEAFRYKANYKRYPDGVVEKIKKRLAGEKLYEGTINNKWDKALTEALVRYRRNNQFRDKPWIGYETTRAMMVPAEFRLAQIKLNMQRLRESRIGVSSSDYHVYINLPEFKGELWDGGEQKLAFDVIVGSRKKLRDPKSRKWRFLTETPLLVDKMETIVLSPSWSVPMSVKAELHRKADRDPNFWKDNGYVLSQGGKFIRQKPGPKNALGLVKFLFPNKDDIYLHDTPDRDLFWHEVRAFSHGCVRVEDPLKLAEYIIRKEDETWSKRKISIKAHSGIEHPVTLSDGPEIHFEYITVRVDPETRDVRFFWDIYHKDVNTLKADKGLAMDVNLYYP